MTNVEFGLMLRQNDPAKNLTELMAYNEQCIQALSEAFTTLWLEDHPQVEASEALECLTTLSYLAATYTRFKVGSLVLAQSYRNPALVAKMAANLQALSGGRMILGIGAGWKEDEYHAYNYPFPSTSIRMQELAEAVQVIRALWSQQPASFKGEHYTITTAYCAPRPNPPIPILIGGGGEQRTLAIVAQHADWYNFNSCTVEEYAHKLDVLRQHCARIGRDVAEIKLTYLSTLSVSEDPEQVQRHPSKHYIEGNAHQVTQELERFRALGISHFMFRIPNLASLEHFVTAVAPRFV